MPYKSRWHIDIPRCSLPSLMFKPPSETLDNQKPIFLDAANPDKYQLTASEYRLWCQRLALGLQRSASFEQGDRVLLFSGNDLYYPVVFMGIIMAGGIFTGANPAFVPRELAYQLKDSQAKYLLCTESSLDTALEAANIVGMPLDRVFLFDSIREDGDASPRNLKANDFRSWETLLAPANEAKHFQWDELRSPGDDCHRTLALNYSSGTTGHPKGVMITHACYVSQLLQYIHSSSLVEGYEASDERARWLNFLPLYHAMSQVLNIGTAFMRRISVYIMPKFDFIKMLEYVQKYRITTLVLAPPIVVALAKHPVVKKFDLSSVEIAVCGAAPLGLEITVEFNDLWPKGCMNLAQGWGMTELTGSVLSWDPHEIRPSKSVGELAPNCEAMIVPQDYDPDSSNRDQGDKVDPIPEITAKGPSARGELYIRGPNVMKGYWRNGAATRQTLTQDGWLKTGDIAYIDHQPSLCSTNKTTSIDFFYIVDRLKELIKVQGLQVAPAELEAILLEHPAVTDAAVVGHLHPSSTSFSTASNTDNGKVSSNDEDEERPTAYIVLRPDIGQKDPGEGDATALDIVDFVAQRVAKYKRLTGGVVFVKAIPKNPSGKILRKGLRDAWDRERKEIAGLAMPRL